MFGQSRRMVILRQALQRLARSDQCGGQEGDERREINSIALDSSKKVRADCSLEFAKDIHNNYQKRTMDEVYYPTIEL
jgi:hypothetical protein